MPSLFKMADDKNTTSEVPVVTNATSEVPVVITQVTAETPKPRNTKKYVIIAVSGVLTVAVILAAILVGMYLFTKAQGDLLKYAVNLDKDTKEVMTTDQNGNVIQYHVQNTNYEMWVVDDFNRDIEMMKIQTKTDTNCYVVPMNRTAATDPSKIKTPSNFAVKANFTDRLTYDVSSTPISDTSFLTKKAKELCKGISVYWMYPKCSDDPNAVQREERSICYSCYYYYYYCPWYPFICRRLICYWRWC